MSRSKLVVGLDIGTTKICAVVGEVTDGQVEILGVGSHPSKGLRKGVVNNLESTCESIERALDEAEKQSECEINSVYVGITGWQIKSMMSHGVAKLRKGTVGKEDFERVMEAAEAVVLPQDREVIHCLPCEYVVDGRHHKNPLGLPGVRFEVNCHVVTSAIASVDNLLECCRHTELYVNKVVFEPLASAQSVLIPGERDGGVALLDIGGGTSDLVIMRNGCVVHSAVIALGGNHITSDISKVLKVPSSPTAEQLKREYGVALRELADDENIEVEIPETREVRSIPHKLLAEIIENRMEEILRLVYEEMENSGFGDDARTGIVLTGGCSLLAGIDQLAQRIFKIPARIGRPMNIKSKVPDIDNPALATGIGLVLQGAKDDESERGGVGSRLRVDGIFSKMKSWFGSFF